MIGTIANTAAIAGGCVIGLTIGKRVGVEMKDAVIKVLSLAVILMGIKMGMEDHDFIAVAVSLVLGTMLGEWIDIEARLDQMGLKFQKLTNSKSNTFVLGFVSASVLFCVGSMAVIGSVKDGLQGDPSVLYVKSMLDGVASIIMASTLGIGVIFSAVSVLIYQGALTLLASQASFLLSDPMYVNGISMTGGIIIMAIGLNMLEVVKLRTANMLPSLFIIPVYDAIWLWM